jgi:hypothetical protein
MPTVHRVLPGTLSASVPARPRPPNALDEDAVLRASIPQSTFRPGYTGVGPGAAVRTPRTYDAARTWGFYYPGSGRHTTR